MSHPETKQVKENITVTDPDPVSKTNSNETESVSKYSQFTNTNCKMDTLETALPAFASNVSDSSNNNENELSYTDNRKAQNFIYSSLTHDEIAINFFGHSVQVHLNRIEDGIPENNNLLEVNTFGNTQYSNNVRLEGGEHDVVFEYCGKVEDKSYKQKYDSYHHIKDTSESETEGLDSCGSIDEVGIDSANLINGNASSENSSVITFPLEDVLGCDVQTEDDLEVSYEQSSLHSSTQSINSSYIENTTTEDVSNLDSATYTVLHKNIEVDVDNESSAECDADEVGTFPSVINSSSECTSSEYENIQELDTSRTEDESSTGAISEKTEFCVNSPIIEPQNHTDYGSTSKNEGKSSTKGLLKLRKSMKNKKKEPGIT